MSAFGIKAFSDKKYDYYRLTKDFGVLKKGAIFYHDPDDHTRGSQRDGCLLLCWTPDGNCYGGICGGTVALHYSFAKTDWFEKVDGVTGKTIEKVKSHTRRAKQFGDDAWISMINALLLIFCGVWLMVLARYLPEWQVGMMLVGAIVLSFCIYKVM